MGIKSSVDRYNNWAINVVTHIQLEPNQNGQEDCVGEASATVLTRRPPANKCANGKWKWGETGACKYDTKKQAEDDNSSYRKKLGLCHVDL